MSPDALSARRPAADNARAVRAAVTLMLTGKPCECGAPDWHVANVGGQIRHLSCRSCGRTGKLGPDTVKTFIEKCKL